LTAGLEHYAHPGAWNDPDFLLTATSDLSPAKAQFSLWSMMAAPLIICGDLRHMSAATRTILTNEEVIAVDQDVAGNATRVASRGPRELWRRVLANGDRALLVLNMASRGAEVAIDLAHVGLPRGRIYRVRDLWNHRTFTTRDHIRFRVAGHDVAMFRVST